MKAARPRIRLCLEQLEDRIVPSTSPIDLTLATTTDSRTISVNYTINGNSLAGQNVSFNIYRSATYNSLTGAQQLIGTATIPGSDATDLSTGKHTGVKLSLTAPNGQPLTILTPNTALPFVVVVANDDGSSASFETHVLGVIAHGSEFDPLQILLNQAPPWEMLMAADLHQYAGYEAVIPFNWIRLCLIPSPLAVKIASDMLYTQVTTTADLLASEHPGDVVDINFIGDSRGTVVISQVLQKLVGTKDPALQGGFMQMTLLDPHPSNLSTPFSALINLPQAKELAVLGLLFEYLTQDPAVVVPANVDQVQDFDEQTPAGDMEFLTGALKYLSAIQLLEFMFSLEGLPAGSIPDYSNQPIEQENLTDVYAANIGLIGHAEVPLWYLYNVVNTDKTFTYFD
jgi:hypothetical protein